MLLGLGELERMLGRNDEARAAYTEARALYRAVENRLGEANVLLGLGELERMLGRNDEARTAYTEARALYRAVENRLGEANVLLGLGRLEHKLGRNDEARAAYTEARALYRAVGDRLGEANVLLGLGELKRMLGRNDEGRAQPTPRRARSTGQSETAWARPTCSGAWANWSARSAATTRLKKNFHQAAYVYGTLGMEDYKDLTLELAEALGGQDN